MKLIRIVIVLLVVFSFGCRSEQSVQTVKPEITKTKVTTPPIKDPCNNLSAVIVSQLSCKGESTGSIQIKGVENGRLPLTYSLNEKDFFDMDTYSD